VLGVVPVLEPPHAVTATSIAATIPVTPATRIGLSP
jgi:hypothetical protein